MSWLLVKNFGKSIILDSIPKKNVLKNTNITILENFDSRFQDDKILYSDSEKVCVIDGVILNKQELFVDFDVDNLQDYVKKKCDLKGSSIYSDLRGPFTGCYCDLTNDTLYAFGNQTGDAVIYYYHDDDFFSVSNDFNLLYDLCKLNLPYLTFNEIAANDIMSFGYLVNGNTFVKEVRRVKPGELINLKGKVLEENIYHRFTNTVVGNLNLKDSVEKVDLAFRKAVIRCFNKDVEYGYKHHLADISGGLDSRMVSWIAKELGYTNITNVSYSKNNTDESRFAFLAADAMNNELLFKPLDDLNFFYEIEGIIEKNYGAAIYNGITGGKSLLSSLNFNKFGLEHTGMLGDVIVGSFCSHPNDLEVDIARITLSDLIQSDYTGKEYPNYELFAMYNRGFQAAVTTHFIRRNYTEVVSPYIDVDFLQCCFSIPLEFRCGHKLYWEWILTKYPEAARIPSTRKLPSNQDISSRNLARKIIGNNKRFVLKILKKIKWYSLIQSPNDMNPLNYWYDTNPKIQDFFENYYSEHIDLLKAYPTTKKNVELLFSGDKQYDKSLAITVLGAYSVYFAKK
jgi:asparagine synthase (glutamine-hydrolysing)